MFKPSVPHNDVALRILNATDCLMAEYGVQYLSTHKIAKQAGVSVGTIYLYFKDKDDLLNQLVLYLFDQFNQAMALEYDESLPLFEQYKRQWQAYFSFMQQHPNTVKNMHQYESLPQFQQLLRQCVDSQAWAWDRFVRAGQAQGVIAPLPPYVLFAMSLRMARDLLYHQFSLEIRYEQALLDEVILRTWKAISL